MFHPVAEERDRVGRPEGRNRRIPHRLAPEDNYWEGNLLLDAGEGQQGQQNALET
jgi:hypothetical protein